VTEPCAGLTTRLLTTDDAQAVFEVIGAFTLRRTLNKRAVDMLAYSTDPAPPTGQPKRSTDAWNTGAALSSASATSPPTYIARPLLETGGFRPHLHPRS
jgi:transposase